MAVQAECLAASFRPGSKNIRGSSLALTDLPQQTVRKSSCWHPALCAKQVQGLSQGLQEYNKVMLPASAGAVVSECTTSSART